MKIYIAGPYTGNPEENVHVAIAAAEYCAARGHTPFIPHLTHYWEADFHHDYEFWMKQDLEWLAVCSAILRLPGVSAGADREVAFALSHGIVVYNSILEIPDWSKKVYVQ